MPPRFEPDGLPVVVDGLVESGVVLRGDAEAVPGRDPVGVKLNRLASSKQWPRPGPDRGIG